MLLGKEYDQAIDWWQLGIMTFQMLTQTSPFGGEGPDEVYDCILEDEVEFPGYMPEESGDFVGRLLEKEPGKRLGSGLNGADQVMAHAFFWGVEWEDVYYKRVAPPFVPEARGPMDLGQDNSQSTYLEGNTEGTLSKPVVAEQTDTQL